MDRDVQAYMVFSWEEDRKMVLRIWSLVFGILATLMLLSTIGGRMAYVQGSYTGYIGFWTDCKRHKCASLGQVTVLIHMSQGFMILALALCVFLLPCMGLSFWSGFHRLNKIDAVFSSLSLSIGIFPSVTYVCLCFFLLAMEGGRGSLPSLTVRPGVTVQPPVRLWPHPSAGLLILLSLTLFVVNCKALEPEPQLAFQETFYLCWCACALMLCAGAVSHLNQAGIWSIGVLPKEWRISYRRWTVNCSSLHGSQQKGADMMLGHTQDLPDPGASQDSPSCNTLDLPDTDW
ncbi:PREDICTED: uncharacterized protein LOC102012479 isoform X1 [Chinchilla lanigera]|uniref:uncharacterized protein LOC102012479 isoform X1 n=1 Tax=Chinchilla lanigera TaxID=34839 RepID=UPI000697525E|nr:PREDICTED: uncharacterized protein LOC102012479 isoform X1 [Chinchilla lanigera]XP_013364382.1 PREDICTED: uncharacterized protein LOC102012479 isoform X1 [Chinchilla lanigera]XP_013364383.1 PREDICTED: uncharacterized protein LOC102012479 isoform X1 [Chinchilla lanigera]XP_013364384.1 PREDICTED: uncharacterized protein LOC102012479 isoform X1 [Chinchilla lanigera]XP_013364385.1 PREDICTED: uncharacterized protein LOC102012479 isoform X1 [Chinchilla lanigera]XP_013364386.1 PREDICTED: uncharact